MIRIGGSKDSASAIMAYSGFGYPNQDEWRVHISGVAWQTPIIFNMRQRMMIRMLGGVMHATPEEMNGEVFQSRITPFMAEADHRQTIIATINGTSYRLKKRTRKNGHFHDWLSLKKDVIENSITTTNGVETVNFSVAIEGADAEPAESMLYLQPKQGISIISDIDDTIKVSNVGDRHQLLANTFLREFQGIEGMAELYNDWFQRGTDFHYVSSSPWQLHAPLLDLQTSGGFPRGTIHLRNFQLRNHVVQRALMIRRHGKSTSIKSLLQAFPQRKFILIGDSGEKDPEIYRKICRKYSDQVAGLFIRDIKHNPVDAERLAKCRDALPNAICDKFESADDLRELVSPILAAALQP